MYKVSYGKRALKDAKALPLSVKKRVAKAIQEKLLVDPIRCGKPLQYSLRNIRALRVGDYRVAYALFEKDIKIIVIGHRSKIYTELQKRM